MINFKKNMCALLFLGGIVAMGQSLAGDMEKKNDGDPLNTVTIDKDEKDEKNEKKGEQKNKKKSGNDALTSSDFIEALHTLVEGCASDQQGFVQKLNDCLLLHIKVLQDSLTLKSFIGAIEPDGKPKTDSEFFKLFSETLKSKDKEIYDVVKSLVEAKNYTSVDEAFQAFCSLLANKFVPNKSSWKDYVMNRYVGGVAGVGLTGLGGYFAFPEAYGDLWDNLREVPGHKYAIGVVVPTALCLAKVLFEDKDKFDLRTKVETKMNPSTYDHITNSVGLMGVLALSNYVFGFSKNPALKYNKIFTVVSLSCVIAGFAEKVWDWMPSKKKEQEKQALQDLLKESKQQNNAEEPKTPVLTKDQQPGILNRQTVTTLACLAVFGLNYGIKALNGYMKLKG